MGPVRLGSSSRKGFSINSVTGPTLGILLLLIFITGAQSWPWGSVTSCPPGPEPECPKNPENDTINYFPHPTDCHYYVQCDGSGKAICRRCSPTTYFSPNLSNCVWPIEAKCEHNATTRQSSLLPPVCIPDRDNEINGTILLPEECGDIPDCRYYYFVNCTEKKYCANSQHINKLTRRCENWCTAGCLTPSDIPQCRQCQKEGEILKYDCQAYTVCTNGIPEQVKCKPNEHFDKTTKKCITGSCCEDAPDVKDCSYYITNCNERKQCPPNQHFIKRTKKCENFCSAGCLNPLDIPECRECPIEDKVLNYDCHFYTVCKNGRPLEVKCKNDEHYDENVGKCLPGSCCEDKPDPSDCGFYITNCNKRVQCPVNQHFNSKTQKCENICTAKCKNPLDIPQCRQCPVEGEIIQSACDHYTICQNGEPQQVNCEANEHFDKKLRKCISGSCCEDKPDPNDCSSYITNCNKRVSCPPRQHFNKKTRKCDDACTAGCLNPVEIPECRQCQNEGEILQHDCQYYTVCNHGKPEQIKCSISEHFDLTTKKCLPGSCCEDKPDHNDCAYYITNCNERVQCPPNQHFNKNSKRCEDFCLAGCLNALDIPQCRQCPNEEEVLKYDCQQYTICKNGKPQVINCSINEHFDQMARKCIAGSCCEDEPDINDCAYYITNCNQRVSCPPNQHFNKKTKRCENICTAGCQNFLDIPQCRQCPVEGQILHYECQYYIICQNGKPEQRNCSSNERYDSKAGKCLSGSCCEDKPDPSDCGYYITNCNQRVSCPSNQHFNKKTNRCENVCTAGCQNPLSIPQCRECPTERAILQYDCQYFVICRNGVPEKVNCSVIEHFDLGRGKCVPGSCCEDKPDPNDCGFYITNCNQRTPCPLNQHFNKISKRCENICTAGCVNPTDNPQCRKCPREGEILNYDCHYYSICRNGKLEQVNCNVNEKFDPVVSRCIPGSCCPDKPDPSDCGYYVTNCNQRKSCPSGQHFSRVTLKCEDVCTAGCQNPLNIPQCNKCIENKILQSECQQYTICRNGKPENVKCNDNEKFDSVVGRCVPGSCCPDKPDPSDCGYYITNCNQRRPCPSGQHFSRINLKCEDICIAGCQNPLDIPQCNKCIEGKILQSDCQHYTICKNGEPEQITCNINEHFDMVSRRCIPGSCCEDKPDPNDCSFYFTNCNQRTPCPPNQHFNKIRKRCEDKCTAGCRDPILITGCQRECEPEGRTFEDPCSCDMYYTCQNGRKVLAMCEKGLHYNSTLARCEAPCGDVCVKLFARKPECCASTKGKPEPVCPTNSLSLFLPHPSDSRWFYQCIDGVIYCNRCPPGYRWNIDRDTCEDTCQCP